MTSTNFPKPDRSNYKPNFAKTLENDRLDIAWSEGVLSDGRPFRLEFWCQDQISMLTYFFSTQGLQNTSNDDFAMLLEKERLLKFLTDEKFVSAKTFIDPSGNEMWSINVVIGDEDDTFVEDFSPLKKYEQIK